MEKNGEDREEGEFRGKKEGKEEEENTVIGFCNNRVL